MNETPVIPAAPASDAPKKKKKPAFRRVGTFTMGLCLILGGILLCTFLVRPSTQVLRLLKFSPLVLVALGAELLISHFRFPRARLKYDVLSVVVCCVVLLAGITGTAVGAAADVALTAPVRLDNWRNEIRDTCAGLLADEPIESMEVYFDSHLYDWEPMLILHSTDLNDLYTDSDLAISLHLSGDYDDADDFAREAKRIIRTLHAGKVQPGHLHILGRSPYDDQSFYLQLDGLFAHNLSAAELEELAMQSIDLPPETDAEVTPAE